MTAPEKRQKASTKGPEQPARSAGHGRSALTGTYAVQQDAGKVLASVKETKNTHGLQIPDHFEGYNAAPDRRSSQPFADIVSLQAMLGQLTCRTLEGKHLLGAPHSARDIARRAFQLPRDRPQVFDGSGRKPDPEMLKIHTAHGLTRS